jgi:hypothetical protein
MKREDVMLWDFFQIYFDISITITDTVTLMTPMFTVVIMHFFVVWGNFKVQNLLVDFYGYVTIAMPSCAQRKGAQQQKTKTLLTFYG